jgi:amino acid transporter
MKSPAVRDEVTRRHKSARAIVVGLLALTLVLTVVAYLGHQFVVQQHNPTLDMTWRIVVPILGLGAVVWRRTKFSAMRLQDILALRGVSGLLATLQRTTAQVALMGGAIAILGFIVTMLTGLFFYMLGAGIIAAAVLLYCYPRRSAWESVVKGIEETDDEEQASPPAKGSMA